MQSILNSKKSFFLSLIFLSFFINLPAQAQSYIEVDYSKVSIASTASSSGELKTTPSLISLIVGQEMNANLDIEGLLATGIQKSDTTLNGATQTTPVNTSINNYYGVFAKPKMKLNDSVELFSRVGYVYGKTSGSTSTNSISTSSGNWAYALGLNYSMSPSTFLSGSYQQSAEKNNVKSNTLSIGVGFRLGK
jgi:opacity protein-like surface antigen